jgi:hypothetical protein
MKDSTFVHVQWSTSRVPELIPFVHRVSVEYQNQFPKSVLGMSFRTLLLSLVIPQSKKRKEK